MTSLRPTATNMSYLAYRRRVQRAERHILKFSPNRVFSKSTLHTFLIAQSFIGHLPAVLSKGSQLGQPERYRQTQKCICWTGCWPLRKNRPGRGHVLLQEESRQKVGSPI